jgi:glutaminyl-peptide cyclotransferase
MTTSKVNSVSQAPGFLAMTIGSILASAICICMSACHNRVETTITETSSVPDTLKYTTERVLPHDTSSYTEGLLIYNGFLYESSGDPDYSGKSKLMKIDLKSGKVIQQISLDKKYFGEGIVILHDTIYQLTYKEKKIFVYNMDFRKINELTITTDNGQGWGMTTDSTNLIVDDGSSNLYYYRPSTFELIKKITIVDAGSPTYNLNELEYVNGYVYANQWQLPYIFKIDPASAKVIAKMDLTDIGNKIQQNAPGARELNGIAYDAVTNKFYITGKKWPSLYELHLSE